MRSGENASGSRTLLGGACLIVIIAGLKEASPILVPLAFSAFLAAISAPLVFWLRRRKVPDLVAVGLVVLVVLAALTGLAGVVGGSVNAFVAAAPRYAERFDHLLGQTLGWLRAHGADVSAAKLREMMDPTAALTLVGGTVTQLASVLSDTLLVILMLVFLLLEATVLPAKIRAALGDPKADLGRFTEIVTEVNEYVVIKTYISLAMGAAAWLTLWALGVDFALLWGIATFLLNFVPNVGALIASIPPVLLALVQFGVARAAAAAFAFGAMHMIIGNMVEPRVMGRRLGLSTLVVFLSLLVWGWVWGAVGMLLSVPLTMIIKILLENSEGWRWLAILMDGEVPGAPPPSGPFSLRPPAPASLTPQPISARSTPPPPSSPAARGD
ncbi:MAG: AI-2E family transporter [Polyangiaceae bacterium]|nr:AI-2E family transporter [Polyangiaceae bacterium]